MPNMGLLGVSDFGTRKIQDHFWMDFVDVLGLWVDVLGCYPCFLRIGMIWDVIHVFWGLAWFGMLSMFSEDWHDLGCYPCFLRIGMIWDVIHVFWGLAWFGMLSMFSEDWHDLGCYPCFLRIGMIWDVIHVFWGLAWFGMLSMFSEDWHDLGCYPCFLRIGMIWDVIHVFWGLAWFGMLSMFSEDWHDLGCYPCFLRIGMIWDVIHVFWGLAWFGMLSMFSEDWHDLGCYPCFLRIGMILWFCHQIMIRHGRRPCGNPGFFMFISSERGEIPPKNPSFCGIALSCTVSHSNMWYTWAGDLSCQRLCWWEVLGFLGIFWDFLEYFGISWNSWMLRCWISYLIIHTATSASNSDKHVYTLNQCQIWGY